MEGWYKDFIMSLECRYPWIVSFIDSTGEVQQVQVSGLNAQYVADYIRNIYHIKTINFIAKLDNTWE